MSTMNLGRRTFLAGLVPITIAGAAEAGGPLKVACTSGFKPAMARIAVALEAPPRVDYGEAGVLLQRLAAGDRPQFVVLAKSALEPLGQQDAAAGLIRYLHGALAAQAIEAAGTRRIP